MNGSDENPSGGQVSTSEKSLEGAIQYAKKYLEDLLSFFGLNTDVYATSSDGEVIELHVPSTHLNGFLIGQHGDTMRALQFMIGTALRNNDYEVVRVNVDIADYKKGRADRLSQKAEEWLRQVRETGEPMHLSPMNAADRRTIHKLADDSGMSTESVGEGRDRHIVLKPAAGSAPEAETTPADKPEEPAKDTEEAKTESETEEQAEEKEPETDTTPDPEPTTEE